MHLSAALPKIGNWVHKMSPDGLMAFLQQWTELKNYNLHYQVQLCRAHLSVYLVFCVDFISSWVYDTGEDAVDAHLSHDAGVHRLDGDFLTGQVESLHQGLEIIKF